MLTVIVLAVVALSLIGAAGYAAIATMHATETVTLVQRNAGQVQSIAALLTSALRASGRLPLVPLDVKSVDGALAADEVLPPWLVPIVNEKTPWGASYGFCSYSAQSLDTSSPPTNSTVLTVTGPAGSTYNAAVRESPHGSGHYYVVASDAPPGGGANEGMMFILSPLPGSMKTPDCSKLSFDGTSYSVTGGSVYPVPASLVTAVDNSRKFGNVTYVAPALLGDGTGSDPDDAMALTEALANWELNTPATSVFKLAPGSYTLAQSDIAAMGSQSYPSTTSLTMSAEGDGVVLAPSASGQSLALPVSTTLENITVSGDMAVTPHQGSSLTLNGVSIPSLYASMSDVNMGGKCLFTGSGVSAAGASITVIGGRLRIDDGAVIQAVAPTSSAGAAALRLVNGASMTGNSVSALLNVSGTTAGTAYGMDIESGSRATLIDSSVLVTGTPRAAIGAGGNELGLFGTSVSFTAAGMSAIEFNDGHLDLASDGSYSTILGTPTVRLAYGVVENGGFAASGKGALVYGAASVASASADNSTCLGTEVSGKTPSVFSPDGSASNRTTWTCR